MEARWEHLEPKKRLSPQDLALFHPLSGAQLSPDGTRVVYVVSGWSRSWGESPGGRPAAG